MPGKRREEPWRPKRPDPKKPLVETTVMPVRGQGFPYKELLRRIKMREQEQVSANPDLNTLAAATIACAEGALSTIEHFHPNFNKAGFIEHYWDYEAAVENWRAYTRQTYLTTILDENIRKMLGKPQPKGAIDEKYSEKAEVEKRLHENGELMKENLLKAFQDKSVAAEYMNILNRQLGLLDL